MASTTTDIDYKNNYFEYPELTRIHGLPTTTSLIELRDEIRANAQSVITMLGGGKWGHMGLVCSPTIYATMDASTPYIHPVNPGPFQVQGINLGPAEVTEQKAAWDEKTRLYREVNGVERNLKQQIVSAMDRKYLRALQTPGTKKINKTIPQILSYLFDCYGTISPKDLSDMKKVVTDYDLDPGEPVDTLFGEVDDLNTMCEIAQEKMSDEQLISMAFAILQRTGKYKNKLTKWVKKLPANKTWENFKTYIRSAQKNLRDQGDLTVATAMSNNDIINVVTQSINNAIMKTQEDEDKENYSPIEAMNAAMAKEKSDMEKQLNTLKEQIAQMAKFQQMPPQPSYYQPQSGQQWPSNMQNMQFGTMQQQRPWNNNNNNNNNNSNNRRNNKGRYCWTHGACNHWGRTCQAKANGHQDDASFKNTKNGNTNGVRT